jgi:secreted trypsin-like serine protease
MKEGEMTVCRITRRNIQVDDIPLYTVRAGSPYHQRFGQSVNVKLIIKHPDYRPFKALNDIAIVKLLRPLIFEDTVQPIKIHTKKIKFPRKALVSGWSADNYRKDSINHIIVPLIHLDECAEMYGASAVNRSTQLCMGEGKHENCQGDSGSGIVIDYKLVGIVTHNTRCENREFPSLHTKMSCHGKWVKNQLV